MFTFTLYDLLEKHIPQHAHYPALVADEVVVNYGELKQSVDKVAHWLFAQGIKRGDRVGIHLPKSIEEVIATFAIARLGAVFVNINYQWTLRQLAYIVEDSAIFVLLTDSYKARQIIQSQLIEQLENIVIKGKPFDHPKLTLWTDLLAYMEEKSLPLKPIDTDLAALLYTSGSTGHPKGVVLTHANLIQGARSVACYLNNTQTDRVLGLLPMSFDYGLSQVTTLFLVGGTVVLQAVAMPAEIVKTINNQQVTGMAAVPPIWIQLIRYLEMVDTRLPSLRYLTNSGGKIPTAVLRAMPQIFPAVDIYLMYGLTEAFRSTYLPPSLFHEKMGAIGQAIPNTELFVVSPEKGLCQAGEQGELIHRGALISLGYWNNPTATAEKIKVCEPLRPLIGDEKVLFSGDIVYFDEAGILWFVSRADSLIKSSGFRISPTEVEDIVYESGMVVDVVAFGVEDEMLGQVVQIVASSTENTLNSVALMDYCRKNMPHYMVPQKIHRWSGQMPRTSSGKIDRSRVISTYQNERIV